VRLAFERVGSGEPLVLVHGVGHRRQAWYPVLDQLAEQHEVVLVDLPGHGASDPLVTEGRPMADVLRRVFKRFLAEQQLHRPHMAGNSLGGRIALEAGVEGDARSVTALSPAGFWRSDLALAYSRRLFATMSGLSRALAPRAAWLAHTRPGRVLGYAWLTAHPVRIDPERALADFHAFRAAQPALREILAAATRFSGRIAADIPVAVAWASRDVVFPRNQALRAQALLPDAEHVLLRGCGHVPMTDAPDNVAELILRTSSRASAKQPTPVVDFGRTDPSAADPRSGAQAS
jgi:pimeloyl-ACP methyl ester carboxylesterase